MAQREVIFEFIFPTFYEKKNDLVAINLQARRSEIRNNVSVSRNFIKEIKQLYAENEENFSFF